MNVHAKTFARNRAQDRGQRGIALVVALVLLIAVTLVGLAAIRGTALQEKMSGNMYDRELAFQAAEAALTVAANQLTANPAQFSYATAGVTDCSSGQCAPNPVDDGNVNWQTVTVTSGTPGANEFQSAFDTQPQFVVQKMGSCSGANGVGSSLFVNDENNQGANFSTAPSGTCYRITARSGNPGFASNADRAQVVVQAIYRL